MSSKQEKITQTIYTGSLLSQELHPVPRNHWVSTMQSKSKLQHHTPKKWPWTPQATPSFGTQHHKNQNTLWLCTYTTIPKNTRDRERITPDQYPKRKYYNNPIPLLCENPKAWCKSWKLKSVFSISKCLNCFLNIKMSKLFSILFRSVKQTLFSPNIC